LTGPLAYSWHAPFHFGPRYDTRSYCVLHLESRRKRSLMEKLKEFGSSWFSYWL